MSGAAPREARGKDHQKKYKQISRLDHYGTYLFNLFPETDFAQGLFILNHRFRHIKRGLDAGLLATRGENQKTDLISGNRDFFSQVNILDRVKQINTIPHRFLKGFPA